MSTILAEKDRKWRLRPKHEIVALIEDVAPKFSEHRDSLLDMFVQTLFHPNFP